MRIRKCLCFALALFTLCAPRGEARGENGSSGALAHRGTVRVYLSSLGNPSALNLTLTGDYTAVGSQQVSLGAGQKVKIGFNKSSGAITLTVGGQSYGMGQNLTLRRHSTDPDVGLRIAEGRISSNVYPGDLSLTAKVSGSAWRLYPVMHVHMEDYLTGVLPYEMGNSAALESLKAQAVAARTYTINRMNQRNNYIYDLVDTTNDQVYNGNNPGTARCTEAVRSTAGLVLHWGDKPIIAYYSASNGGQTESAKNAWGSVGYDYLTVKDDPFDKMNTASVVKRAKIYADNTSTRQSTRLKVLLNSKARAQLEAQGLSPQSVQVRTIRSITPTNPRYAAPSALYTKLSFETTVVADGTSYDLTLKCDIFSELEGALGLSINSTKNELWSVVPFEGGFTVEARRFGHGIGLSQRGAMQMGTMGYTFDQILAFYYVDCQLTQYDLGGGAPPASVPEGVAMATVRSNAQGLRLALMNAPSPTARVLTGLVPGTVVTVHSQGSPWSLVTAAGLTGYAATDALQISGTPDGSNPAPSSVSQWATVSVNGVLNLRAAPSYEADVPATIPNGEILPVYDVSGEWARVQFGSMTGYCALSFLQLHGEYPLPVYIGVSLDETPAPTQPPSVVLPTPVETAAPELLPPAGQITPEPPVYTTDAPVYTTDTPISTTDTPAEAASAPENAAFARVNTEYGKLNLRIQPKSGAAVLLTIPQNEILPVLSRGGGWVKTTYGGKIGYVREQFLLFDPALTPPLAAQSPQSSLRAAWVVTERGSLNLRKRASTSAALIDRIPQGAAVTVLDSQGDWCYISYEGKTGYVQSQFLGDAPPQARVYDETLRAATDVQARILSQQAAVRRWCADTAPQTGMLTSGALVTVLELGDTWSRIQGEGLDGYCKTSELYLMEAP